MAAYNLWNQIAENHDVTQLVFSPSFLFLFFSPSLFFSFSLFLHYPLHSTVPYPTPPYFTLSHYHIHCAHVALEPPQEATTVGDRLKHGHYSYT